jgi:hypothetical protein
MRSAKFLKDLADRPVPEDIPTSGEDADLAASEKFIREVRRDPKLLRLICRGSATIRGENYALANNYGYA